MSKNPDAIVGLDIGTTKICAWWEKSGRMALVLLATAYNHRAA